MIQFEKQEERENYLKYFITYHRLVRVTSLEMSSCKQFLNCVPKNKDKGENTLLRSQTFWVFASLPKMQLFLF